MSGFEAVEVVVRRHSDGTFGFNLEQPDKSDMSSPIFVINLNPLSPAGATQRIKDGMRVVSIGKSKIDGYSLSSAKNLLRTTKDIITVGLERTEQTPASSRASGINWNIAGQSKPGEESYLPTRNENARVVQVPVSYERVQILHNFRGRSEDELDLNRNDIVHVTRRSEDGWCVGECQRTKKIGMFPATYAIRLRPTPKEVEAIYSDLEQLGVTPNESNYEELPGASQGTSPVPYDYGTSLADLPGDDGDDEASSVPVARDVQGYDRLDVTPQRNSGTSPMSPTTPNILYAVVDRNATVVNGDVYATVAKKEDPVYTTLPNEANDGEEPAYAPLGSVQRLTIHVSDTPYAKLPGEEDNGSVTYARLPNEDIPEEAGEAPAIPERKYDLESMMEITVAVQLDQDKADGSSMTYEPLPNDRPKEVTEELYEDLPGAADDDPQHPPALPDRGALSRKTSVAPDDKLRKKMAAEEKKRLKLEKKEQKKIEKLERAKEKRMAKEEKKRRKSAFK
eukprot:TRINITY_DN9536_c0_g2_i4.p1 TRINITY_DN9536_c0_g2~~TRINITY_DN9536_c0_g2_i4.p1  ORF type:complete len:509 (+),score=118.68 TRINITY_DN9536_c0_g2_i4:209-1735(+)